MASLIDVMRSAQIPGWMQLADLLWLADHVRDRRAVVEVGAWKGRTTRVLGDNVAGRIWSVDTWDDGWSGQDLAIVDDTSPGQGRLFDTYMSHVGDLVTAGKVVPIRMLSTAAAAHLLERHGPTFDMVLLDGDPEYASVRDDIGGWYEVLRPGGLLCGHNYLYPGVRRAVDERFGPCPSAVNIWWHHKPPRVSAAPRTTIDNAAGRSIY